MKPFGLFVPLLLVLGNRQFGVSGSLRTLCAAVLPAKADFFRYDWRRTGGWSLAFVGAIVVGGFVATQLLGATTPAISPP